MKIPAHVLPYLNGADYTNELDFALEREPGDGRYLSRIDMVSELLRGKKVVHVGFVDHDRETVVRKRAKGKWMHDVLTGVCSRCVGIDVNEAAVAFVRDELKIPDVYCADITSPEIAKVLGRTEWDCIFMGELIEHIQNPISFLKSVLDNFAANGVRFKDVILSTPNALYTERNLNCRDIERINSDHRYIYTPYTLSKVMTEAGLKVTSIKFCRNGVVKKHTVMKNLYYARFPMLRPTLLATGIVSGQV